MSWPLCLVKQNRESCYSFSFDRTVPQTKLFGFVFVAPAKIQNPLQPKFITIRGVVYKAMLSRSVFCGVVLSALFGLLNSAPTDATKSLDELPLHRVGEIERSIGFYQAIELVENSLLYSKDSEYQSIEVHQTKHFGKLLLLDGVIQLTERYVHRFTHLAIVPVLLVLFLTSPYFSIQQRCRFIQRNDGSHTHVSTSKSKTCSNYWRR